MKSYPKSFSGMNLSPSDLRNEIEFGNGANRNVNATNRGSQLRKSAHDNITRRNPVAKEIESARTERSPWRAAISPLTLRNYALLLSKSKISRSDNSYVVRTKPCELQSNRMDSSRHKPPELAMKPVKYLD